MSAAGAHGGELKCSCRGREAKVGTKDRAGIKASAESLIKNTVRGSLRALIYEKLFQFWGVEGGDKAAASWIRSALNNLLLTPV